MKPDQKRLVWIGEFPHSGRLTEPFCATRKQAESLAKDTHHDLTLYGMPKADWTGCGWDYVTFMQLAPVQFSVLGQFTIPA